MTIYSRDILLSQFGTVCCSMTSSNSCFLTCIQISQVLLYYNINTLYYIWRIYNSLLKWWISTTEIIQSSKYAAAAAKSLQSCPTLCNPIDGGPPGSPVPRILQAKTLEWVAISFSNAWKGKVKVKLLSRVRLFETSWSAAYQAPPSMGFFQARVLEWGAIAFSKQI